MSQPAEPSNDTPYQIIDLLIEGFNADVAEPNVVAVVLEADIAFVILTAAVVEELECEGPFSWLNLLFWSSSVH